MKILFTGASSFTGYWFVKELVKAQNDVTAIFRKADSSEYENLRGERVAALTADACETVFGCSFGDDRFMQIIRGADHWDVVCHHAADVTKYKSPDFDVAAALANNTRSLPRVLDELLETGCKWIILTGSLFENAEGAGSEHLPEFSPYGLSKALTAQVFRYYCGVRGINLDKFVIPNPFGPMEEPRFTTYLARSWFSGAEASVKTPAYVRDNIHVSLLAAAYVDFIKKQTATPARFSKLSPSGYVETQEAFTERFADQMRQRLGLDCRVRFKRQTEFAEPRVRINTDSPDIEALGWDESAAWDELAEYYRERFAGERGRRTEDGRQRTVGPDTSG